MAMCDHPYDHLGKHYAKKGTYATSYYETICKVCDTALGKGDDFKRLREEAYKAQVGWPIVWKDFLGNVLEVGSIIVYPVMSGRSVQITEGVVEEINPPTKGTSYPNDQRIDAPDRLKVMPTGRSARWNQYYSGTHGSKVQKAVTLSANAASAVVVG